MRILHVIPRLLNGGAERLAIDICNELRQRPGIDVKLLVFSNENRYTELTSNLDIIHCPASINLSVYRKNKYDLEKYKSFLLDFKPDIIHSHLFEAEIVTREFILPSTLYFSHLHDNMPQFERPGLGSLFNKHKLTNLFERHRILNNYKKCNNKFISISKDTSAYFIKNLPSSLHDIKRITNAIDVQKFQNGDNNPRVFGDSLRLVSVGSLVDKKNQAFLVDVVATLRKKNIDAELTILGDGPNRDSIQRKIDDFNLGNYVHLKGNVEHVEEYLWNSDIFVHSATYEPLGLVILEAMAAGLPCVCLDGRGNRDIVSNDENGFILKDSDVGLFCERIVQLNEDSKLRERIIQSALDFVKQHDITFYVDKLLACYSSKVIQ